MLPDCGYFWRDWRLHISVSSLPRTAFPAGTAQCRVTVSSEKLNENYILFSLLPALFGQEHAIALQQHKLRRRARLAGRYKLFAWLRIEISIGLSERE